jgi:PAS domain-containing protein
MDAPIRYPELFLAPEERTPEPFWTSLRYYNLYRIAAAAVFLATSLVYDDIVGRHAPEMFRIVSAAYLVLGIAFQVLVRGWREQFNLQLSLHVALDITAITLLMYASGGIQSGIGVMLVITLIGAAIVAPRRLSFLYAALATIALLLEQAYWVLAHDAQATDFLQPALLAIGCFASVGVTSWLAQRVAANEALARQRGRSLANQTRVNQLVIEDMHDGVLVLDRDARVVQHNPQAKRLLGAEALLGRAIGEVLPGFGVATDFELRGRHVGVRMLEAGADEPFRVAFLEDTTRSREQAQSARRHQPRGGAAGRGKARRRQAAPDPHHPRQYPATRAPGVRRAAAQPPRPRERRAYRAAALARRLRGRVRRQRIRAARALRRAVPGRRRHRVRPRAPAPGYVEPAAQRRALRAPGGEQRASRGDGLRRPGRIERHR